MHDDDDDDEYVDDDEHDDGVDEEEEGKSRRGRKGKEDVSRGRNLLLQHQQQQQQQQRQHQHTSSCSHDIDDGFDYPDPMSYAGSDEVSKRRRLAALRGCGHDPLKAGENRVLTVEEAERMKQEIMEVRTAPASAAAVPIVLPKATTPAIAATTTATTAGKRDAKAGSRRIHAIELDDL